MKRLLMIFVSVLLLLGGCSQQNSNSDKLKVVTSFYPLYDFATKIGGDHVNVDNILPAGSEAHDFEPTPQDIVRIENANLFIYHGAGFESWTDKVIAANTNPKLTILEVSKDLKLLKYADEGVTQPSNQDIYDPHTWLDPLLAKQEAEAIKNAYVKLDPKHKEDYEKNYAILARQFDALDEAFHTRLQGLKHRTLVVDHLAYSYLAHRYDLEQLAINGGIVNDEPTAKQIETTIDFIQRYKIPAIYGEVYSNQKIMARIEEQTHVLVLPLNTLESLSRADLEAGHDYFFIMNENLKNIWEGLK